MSDFFKIAKCLEQMYVKPNEDLRNDHLISRPSLYTYVDRRFTNDVEKTGIKPPNQIIKDYPDYAEKVNVLFGSVIKHPIFSKCVFAIPCRVPTDLENTKEFVKNHVPVKIILNRLSRSDDFFKFLTFNFPKVNNPIEIKDEQIHKLSSSQDKFYRLISKSKHPILMDVPMIAIYCENGLLPGFACKVLRDSNKQGVQ